MSKRKNAHAGGARPVGRRRVETPPSGARPRANAQRGGRPRRRRARRERRHDPGGRGGLRAEIDRGRGARRTTSEVHRAPGSSMARPSPRETLAAVVRAEWTYQDDGISGAGFVHRPGLQRLLADLAHAGHTFQSLVISGAVAPGAARQGRRRRGCSSRFRRCVGTPYLHRARDPVMASATDKLVASIDNFAAEAERENAWRRTRDAMRPEGEARARGRWARRFGYTLVRRGRSHRAGDPP